MAKPKLKAAFDKAVAESKQLPERPDNKTLLQIYALYKQATEGDNEEPKPGFADVVARAKWDAWKKLAGASANDAMREYVELIDSLR